MASHIETRAQVAALEGIIQKNYLTLKMPASILWCLLSNPKK